MSQDTLKKEISAAISGNLPFSEPDEENEEELPDGGVVMGWLVVAEWMGTDGQRWLSNISSDAGGKALPKWQVKGYAQEMLDW